MENILHPNFPEFSRHTENVTPIVKETRFYGGDGTIHNTNYVDVETFNGQVVSVWFRCSMLRFKQTEVNKSRAESMISVECKDLLPAINGIEFEL